VVLDSTMSIAQEVIALDRAQVMKTQRGRRPSGANAARSFSTPGSAASEFIPPGPLLRGVTPALYRVLLHVLTKGQSDLTLITCLDDTRRLIQDIGAFKLLGEYDSIISRYADSGSCRAPQALRASWSRATVGTTGSSRRSSTATTHDRHSATPPGPSSSRSRTSPS
jgi:hypothetical protein